VIGFYVCALTQAFLIKPINSIMNLTQPIHQMPSHLQANISSQFLVIDRNDMDQVNHLSVMFPKLISLINNNTNKNFLINFRDEQQRSIIVMVVSN
jgi:hypothetical protein